MVRACGGCGRMILNPGEKCCVTPEDDRPPWPKRFEEMASYWSTYSTCKRKKVGAVIFDPKTKAVVSIGYNDTPIGHKDCGAGGCAPCRGSIGTSLMLDCFCVHAETNALLLAARRGTKTDGCEIATSHPICASCRKHLIQAGITTAWPRGLPIRLDDRG